MMNVIIKPILTEKMAGQGEQLGQYGFIVEQMYNVVVESVNTINEKGKLKARYTKAGYLVGRTNAVKKAIVTLKEGDKIDFYSNI